ncbi:NADPH-dependent oxidoreductase [Paenibacillus sp. FSL H7-0326]|uniref:oxygen-insensitive NADPH nitroreductase n=1 Tax=Paenibacillus sp. FSL H7-0326 TaxID=1921144 RepID=UPI00096BD3EC|nr:oxygen-insensitive NADPH nitroreductase [Paenibacillus sp. FSL H7-0326]OMC67175.1 NADPH-dependent oxidoreductase [Paenibacillus sp. FSL H7-0326]
MNETITLLKSHRSIRKFKDVPLEEGHLHEILTAAQAASTSSNIQAYSAVIVRDKERKSRLGELAENQQQVEESPLFLIWLADLNKISKAIQLHESAELKQNTELFILATVDATLAAQNAAVAAESLGYGIVYIGGIRNRPQEVSDLLALPDLVYPVFGMCIGVPNQEPDIRPRLPFDAVFYEELYQSDKLSTYIQDYDEITSRYYATRKGGGKGGETNTRWSKEMLKRFNGERHREHMYDFLKRRGFDLT